MSVHALTHLLCTPRCLPGPVCATQNCPSTGQSPGPPGTLQGQLLRAHSQGRRLREDGVRHQRGHRMLKQHSAVLINGLIISQH